MKPVTKTAWSVRRASSMDNSMTLLLDTHIIVWLTEDRPSLGKTARRQCNAALAAHEIAISTVVFYELGLLLQRQRIGGPPDLGQWRRRMLDLGLREIPVSAEIAMRAAGLGNLTGDPVDRLIVATALVGDAVLLTADDSLLAWPGGVHRQDAQR
jgi:PIN domain nuclease of toxin-antitoxin system